MPATEIAAIQRKLANDSLEMDEIRLKEQEVAEMPLLDPLQYEELLARGELTDESTQDGEET